MSSPEVPEYHARNKYQAAQARLGIDDGQTATPTPAATPAPESAALPAAAPDPAAANQVGFRPRYADTSPAPIQSVTHRPYQGSPAPKHPGAIWGSNQTSWPMVAGLVAVFVVFNGLRVVGNRSWAPLVLALIAGTVALLVYGLRRWKAQRLAQRRFEQVTRIRPTWTRHNAVSCRSLGVGIKRAGSVWLADDGTAKDLVLAWSADGFEIYGGQHSLTRVISIPWSEVFEVRTERAAVGGKKGQAGLAIVTRKNAVLTAALRPEPTGYRRYKTRTELSAVVTQLRQFVPNPN